MTYSIGIVGLGIMGSRMAQALDHHSEFQTTHAWDLDPTRRQRFKADHPDADVSQPPSKWISKVNAVYIATPPATHLDLVRQVLAAGKGIFCEKPLAIDVQDARRAVADVERAGLPNAINFPFAAAPAVVTLERLVREGIGPKRLEIAFHFSQWPRIWQQEAAGWLSGRAQGGFLREVFSHFAYLTQRLLGEGEVRTARVNYPSDPSLAETYVQAELNCGGLPVTVCGGVGGTAPDFNAWTLYGQARSLRLQDWGQLLVGDASGWSERQPDAREPFPLTHQLDALARTLAGTPALPTLAEGLAVQEWVEGLLQGYPIREG